MAENYTGLLPGGHHVTVTASDPAGNLSSPATTAWTVDTSAPHIAMTAPTTRFTLAGTAHLAWLPGDVGSGIASSAVRWQRAPTTGRFGSVELPRFLAAHHQPCRHDRHRTRVHLLLLGASPRPRRKHQRMERCTVHDGTIRRPGADTIRRLIPPNRRRLLRRQLRCHHTKGRGTHTHEPSGQANRARHDYLPHPWLSRNLPRQDPVEEDQPARDDHAPPTNHPSRDLRRDTDRKRSPCGCQPAARLFKSTG